MAPLLMHPACRGGSVMHSRFPICSGRPGTVPFPPDIVFHPGGPCPFRSGTFAPTKNFRESTTTRFPIPTNIPAERGNPL